VDQYIETVFKELALYQPRPAVAGRPFCSVYFGGGSPSYLTTDQITRLLQGLHDYADWNSVEECTFECEPGTVGLEKFQALKALGVTRVSIGFQTLNDDLLRRTGRDVRVEDCLEAFNHARQAGFDEINIDLLAGLPGETEETWFQTVEQVLKLTPDCITIYQLELTHNSGLYSSLRAGRSLELVPWPVKRYWTEEAFRRCEAEGYQVCSGYMAVRHPLWWRFVYTVEHFWHGADLLALGETSFGHFHGVHYQNFDTFESYLRAVNQNRLPIGRARNLSTEEQLRREVILQLKTGQLDTGYFHNKFGVDLNVHFHTQWEMLRSHGMLEKEGGEFRLSRPGLLKVDRLLPYFYLPEHQGVRYT
jgi:oxygen-independent coproporphyrinogen-3 oxidase